MSDDVSVNAMDKAYENGADAICDKSIIENCITQMWFEVIKKRNGNSETSKVKEVQKKKRVRDNIKENAPIVTNGTCVVEKYDIDNYQQKKNKNVWQWTTELDEQLSKVVEQLGGLDKAKPKKILEQMNVRGLTTAHLSSRIQRLKAKLKREVDNSVSKETSVILQSNNNGLPKNNNNGFFSMLERGNSPQPIQEQNLLSESSHLSGEVGQEGGEVHHRSEEMFPNLSTISLSLDGGTLGSTKMPKDGRKKSKPNEGDEVHRSMSQERSLNNNDNNQDINIADNSLSSLTLTPSLEVAQPIPEQNHSVNYQHVNDNFQCYPQEPLSTDDYDYYVDQQFPLVFR
ncbi:hypothetical protein TSUD_363940 [Trifolium subterraneum]|uniref:HTH myb-type domain-containing protein n=1 Tax=Trifolium subterraneum TaxID=3900 RepID=A0A2Z6NSW2_TRISU|nr:hypothetical protein TSUD_363940 [Trifolium subterraneum]